MLATKICPRLNEKAPISLTPIKLNLSLKNLYAIAIVMELKIELIKLYGNEATLPVTSTNSIDFITDTIKDSLNPIFTKVTNITIFDRPNFTPGTGIGIGIIFSNNEITRDRHVNIDTKTIFFISIINSVYIINILITFYFND